MLLTHFLAWLFGVAVGALGCRLYYFFLRMSYWRAMLYRVNNRKNTMRTQRPARAMLRVAPRPSRYLRRFRTSDLFRDRRWERD